MKLIRLCIYIGSLASYGYSYASIPELEAKGLYTVLKPEYSYLSPINGFNWWNNKIVESMYRYGNENDATIKLVKLLFYLDQTGTTFHPSEYNPIRSFDAKFIGSVCNIILTNQNTFSNPDTQQRMHKELQTLFKGKQRDTKTNPIGPQFATAIIQSLLEQAGTNSQYMLHTTFFILMTFLWQKVSNKSDYQNFFSQIPVAMHPNWQQLLNQNYIQQELQFVLGNVSTITQFISQYEPLSIALHYLSNFANPYPAIIQQQYRVQYKEHTFPDCGETSLRNFFNIILYQPTSRLFDINVLQKEGITPTQSFIDFYTKYSSIKEATDPNAYNDWATVVSSIQNVNYARGSICEISAGLSNMLKVIDHLLFQTDATTLKEITNSQQLDQLCKLLSRPDFQISWKGMSASDAPLSATQINTQNTNIKIVFTVKNAAESFSFTWQFLSLHFEIESITSSKRYDLQKFAVDIVTSSLHNGMTLLSLLGYVSNFSWKDSRPFVEALQRPLPHNVSRQLIFSLLGTPMQHNKAFLIRFFTNKEYAVEMSKLLSSFSINDHALVEIILESIQNNSELISSFIKRAKEQGEIKTIINVLDRSRNDSMVINIINQSAALILSAIPTNSQEEFEAAFILFRSQKDYVSKLIDKTINDGNIDVIRLAYSSPRNDSFIYYMNNLIPSEKLLLNIRQAKALIAYPTSLQYSDKVSSLFINLIHLFPDLLSYAVKDSDLLNALWKDIVQHYNNRLQGMDVLYGYENSLQDLLGVLSIQRIDEVLAGIKNYKGNAQQNIQRSLRYLDFFADMVFHLLLSNARPLEERKLIFQKMLTLLFERLHNNQQSLQRLKVNGAYIKGIVESLQSEVTQLTKIIHGLLEQIISIPYEQGKDIYPMLIIFKPLAHELTLNERQLLLKIVNRIKDEQPDLAKEIEQTFLREKP
jgi:hypothetical protein